MRSGSNVTRMLLEFSSAWHGVCSYWNENICSVEPCVTHPPPSPTVIPLPCPHRGTPSNTGAQLRMGIFTTKTEKRRGALFKNGKNSGGGTRFGRGFTGKFLGTGNHMSEPFLKTEKLRRGYPFWKGVYREIFGNGKIQGGGTLLKGGLPENFEEWEKRRLEPIQNGKMQEGVPVLEGGLPEKFGMKKFSYYICGKE